MRLFNMDLHVSVIADVKDILTRIDPTIKIMDWSLSGHTWVFNKAPTQVDIINQRTWQAISRNMIAEFQAKYDRLLSKFDGFIVAHPNVFALLFEKYGKPVIVVNSCRYDMPACTTGQNLDTLTDLNECFGRLDKKGLLHFLSNNKADQAYFRLANPSVRTEVVPSLCLYTKLTWNPMDIHDKFLLYSGGGIEHPQIIHRRALGRFDWPTLMRFKAIIHIPYEASTMSIFEHISTGAPLFFPTKRFFLELLQNGKVSIQCNYWRTFAKRAPPEYLSATDDPRFWLDRADYYDLEGMYYFDSVEDLIQQLEAFEDTKYEIRRKYIEERKGAVFARWSRLLTDITNNTTPLPSDAPVVVRTP